MTNIEQEIKNLRDDVEHLKLASAPVNIYYQLQSVAENTSIVFEDLKTVKTVIEAVQLAIEKLKSQKIEIDFFTNDDIRAEWKRSGIPQKEIAAYFGVEIPTVCKWLTGSLNDDRKRYDLMTFLRMRGVA